MTTENTSAVESGGANIVVAGQYLYWGDYRMEVTYTANGKAASKGAEKLAVVLTSHAALVEALTASIPALERAHSKAEESLEIVERNDLGSVHWDKAHQHYLNTGDRLNAARAAIKLATP